MDVKLPCFRMSAIPSMLPTPVRQRSTGGLTTIRIRWIRQMAMGYCGVAEIFDSQDNGIHSARWNQKTVVRYRSASGIRMRFLKELSKITGKRVPSGTRGRARQVVDAMATLIHMSMVSALHWWRFRTCFWHVQHPHGNGWRAGPYKLHECDKNSLKIWRRSWPQSPYGQRQVYITRTCGTEISDVLPIRWTF